MQWPTITHLAGELRLWNENTEFASAVYLNAWPSSDEWVIDSVRRRDAECVGRGHIPGYKHRFNARELARQLIDEAKASCGQGERRPTRGRPYFTQAGTDDYAPTTAYPQFYTSNYLNGLGADESPSWQHDCDRCVFLGKYDAFLEELNRDATFDLYICVSKTHGFHTVLARFGNDAPEYLSFTVDRNVLDLFKRRPTYPLAEAYRRAVAAGFSFKGALGGLALGPYRPRPEPPSQPHACPSCGIDMLYPHHTCPTCSVATNSLVYAVPRTWTTELPPAYAKLKKPRKKRR